MLSYELNPFTGNLDAVFRPFTYFDLVDVWRLGTLRNFLEDEEDFSLIDCGVVTNISKCKVFSVGNIGDL